MKCKIVEEINDKSNINIIIQNSINKVAWATITKYHRLGDMN